MILFVWKLMTVAYFANDVYCRTIKSSIGNDDVELKEKGRITHGSFSTCPLEHSEIPVYLSHPNDCNKFYICDDNGTPHLKSCPPGLHFNPKVNACDYPENAGCDGKTGIRGKGRIVDEKLDTCPLQNSEIPVYLTHPEDCSKFYICDSGTPHLKSCLPGLYFNPKVNACDYPKNAGCIKNVGTKGKGGITDEKFGTCPLENSEVPVYLTHPDDCSKFYICDSGTPHLKSCLPGLHFSTKINACDYPKNAGCNKNVGTKGKDGITDEKFGTCPLENSDVPVYLTHPNDCSKFYICDSGTPHLKSCLPGLHFNPKINACDYPKNAGCNKNVGTKGKGRITDEEFGTCPLENSEVPVYLAHPNDCSKFYICDSGTPHLKSCLPGLHFNTKINACDYPKNAGCNKNVGTKGKDRITDEEFGTCPLENSEVPVYLAHPSDCSKFYICDSGTPHLKSCQPGLHFNPKINACDYPKNAGCNKNVETKGKDRITDEEFGTCPLENSEVPVYLAHPSDCSKFYICDSGTPHLKSCQPGLHFNTKVNACDYPKNAGCDEILKGVEFLREMVNDDGLDSCPLQSKNRPSFIPHPTECEKYFICYRGKRFSFTCPSGLYFNPKQEACDFPKNTDCDKDLSGKLRRINLDDSLWISCPDEGPLGNPVLLPHPKDCDKFYICDHGKPVLKRCQLGMIFNEIIKECDFADNAVCGKQMSHMRAGVSSPFCPPMDGKSPVFFRSSSNCTVYYMCGNGLAYEFSCPARLHFNLRKKQCDYEENANCQIVDP